jgi:hypothetical protein
MSHGNEPQASANGPVAIKCAAYAQKFSEKTDSLVNTVEVTTHPNWGVVFRADIVTERGDRAPIISRLVCTNSFTYVGRIAPSSDGP